jgi:hypothetical protein
MKRVKLRRHSFDKAFDSVEGQEFPKNSSALNRHQFIEKIRNSISGEILEIGPLNRPLIEGHFVRYFDLLPTSELKNRAKAEGLDPNGVPKISFYHPNGDLSVIDRKFHDVVSAHCVEHQPDLIKHLYQVGELLENEGSRYWVIIPDKRYCFDALLPVSSFIEIVQAHVENHVKPSIWKVIEHRAMTTHNDSVEHWKGNNGAHGKDIKERWNAARLEFEAANGKYIDVHVWQFTPESFVSLIGNLQNMGMVNFEVEQIFETPTNDLEFCVVLRKTAVNS